MVFTNLQKKRGLVYRSLLVERKFGKWQIAGSKFPGLVVETQFKVFVGAGYLQIGKNWQIYIHHRNCYDYHRWRK